MATTMNPKSDNNLITSLRANPASMKRGALGKGLGALIPGKAESQRDYFECPIARIKPAPDQPRRRFDEQSLNELAESIARSGIIQPLVVRQDGADYRLIAGERRWRASQKAGLTVVPVVIKDVDPDIAFELALIENIQREDLNPVEEAEAYQRLMTLRGYTQEVLAESLGKSRSTIANTLRLLNLDAAVQESVAAGDLSSGAARAILGLSSADQPRAAQAAVEQGMTVRQLEAVVRRVKAGAELNQAIQNELSDEPAPAATAALSTPEPPPTRPARHTAPSPRSAEPQQTLGLFDRVAAARAVATALAARVDVFDDEEGQSGSIEIFFKNDEDLARIVALIKRAR